MAVRRLATASSCSSTRSGLACSETISSLADWAIGSPVGLADAASRATVGWRRFQRWWLWQKLVRVVNSQALSLVSGVLEHNIEIDRVQQFKLALFERLARTGALLERHLDLRHGTGVRTLLRLHALIVGLRTLAEPGPVAAEAMRHPELSGHVIDFNEEMREMLVALFRMAATA